MRTRLAYAIGPAALLSACFQPADNSDTGDSGGSTSGTDATASDSLSSATMTASETSATATASETATATATETSVTDTSVDTSATDESNSTGAQDSESGGPECGDGTIDRGEECDDGPGNGPGMACSGECVLNVCGDGDPGPDEACDNGAENGEDLGDCAPDCSKLVESKLIVLSDADINGNLGADPVGTADSFCPAGYLAMFVFGDTRRATTAANEAEDSIDWVIQPWTQYLNADGLVVWQTGALPLLGVDGGVFTALMNPIGSSGGVYTGLAQDWTTLQQDNCNGWSVGTNGAGHNVGIAGSTSVGFINNGGVQTCEYVNGFYCVEQ